MQSAPSGVCHKHRDAKAAQTLNAHRLIALKAPGVEGFSSLLRLHAAKRDGVEQNWLPEVEFLFFFFFLIDLAHIQPHVSCHPMTRMMYGTSFLSGSYCFFLI